MNVYVAQKKLKVSVRGGNPSVINYNPGDVIPDFDSWQEAPKRSNLAMNYVERMDSQDLNEAQKEQLKSWKKPAEKVAKVEVKPEPRQELVDHVGQSGSLHFKCDICGSAKFMSSKALRTHITLAHKNKKEE